MISDINSIYKKTADKYDLDYKMVKSIGDAVFSHTKDKLMDLDNGSVYLTHVGSFIIKSVKIEKQLRRYLNMRAYKCSKYPDFVDRPISKKAKVLFDLYRNTIIPFKKYKVELSERQVEFAKKLYESYNQDSEQDGDKGNQGKSN